MSKFRIKATFVTIKNTHEEYFALAHAWDEFDWDSNPDGFDESRQKALDSYGDEIVATADVDILVDEAAILAVLRPKVTITGEVRASGAL